MKKVVGICLIVFAAALIAACNGAVSNPAAPDPAGLSVSSGSSNLSVAAAEARHGGYVNVCHNNPDWETDLDGDPAWVVVTVSTQGHGGNSASTHCDKHGDYNQNGTSGCYDCDAGFNLDAAVAGDDCSACLGIS